MKRKITDINANPKLRSDDPAWYFMGELLLSEILAYPRRDELTNGLWVQTVRELRMPLECVENIKRTLTGFARGAWMHAKQGKLDTPGRIRLFFTRKLIEDLSSGKTPKTSFSECTIESGQMIPYSGTQMFGGWGYFLIERSANFSPGSSGEPHHFVDLYFYTEGK